MTLKAVILDYQSLAPSDLELDALWGLPLEWHRHDYTTVDETAARIAGMDIVLTNKVVLDKALLEDNPQLKLVIILATGTNNIDLEAAKNLQIPVCNIINYSTESVVQHTFACLLSLVSRLREYDRAVRQGSWNNSPMFTVLDYPIQEIAGKTMGIIGYGAIGKRVAEVAEAFGMKVLVSESLVPGSSTKGRTPRAEVLAKADVLSVHCPLSDYSYHLLDSAALASMKPSAILLNMARGGIVHEQALLQALTDGTIACAATDVLSREPPPADHPLLKPLDNLLVTPHIGWASREARQELVAQVDAIIRGYFNNRLINQVNR